MTELAMKIEEYVPKIIPRRIASDKLRIASPPKASIDPTTSVVEKLVRIVLRNVWLILVSTITAKG